MTTTSRVLSTLLTITVLLSVTASVSAQTADTEPISVELEAPGMCTVDIASNGTLGTWRWNGTSWVNLTEPDWISFNARMLNMPLDGCRVNVGFTGLTGPGGEIPPANFTATAGGNAVDPHGWSVTAHDNANYLFSFSLTSIPAGVTAPGTYSGTVKVDVADAA